MSFKTIYKTEIQFVKFSTCRPTIGYLVYYSLTLT